MLYSKDMPRTAADIANAIVQDPETQRAAFALRPENFERWITNNWDRIMVRIAKGV